MGERVRVSVRGPGREGAKWKESKGEYIVLTYKVGEEENEYRERERDKHAIPPRQGICTQIRVQKPLTHGSCTPTPTKRMSAHMHGHCVRQE